MSKADSSDSRPSAPSKPLGPQKGLESMEALLRQSAMGIHILFENADIAKALKAKVIPAKDAMNLLQMQKVQDVMSKLIAKTSYAEKVSFLQDLDPDSYHLLIRTYFHIVDNTVRSGSEKH